MKKGLWEQRPFQNSLCLSNQTQPDKIHLCAFIVLELTAAKHLEAFWVWLCVHSVGGALEGRPKVLGNRLGKTNLEGLQHEGLQRKAAWSSPASHGGWLRATGLWGTLAWTGVGDSMALSYRGAKPRTLTAFPNACVQGSEELISQQRLRQGCSLGISLFCLYSSAAMMQKINLYGLTQNTFLLAAVKLWTNSHLAQPSVLLQVSDTKWEPKVRITRLPGRGSPLPPCPLHHHPPR